MKEGYSLLKEEREWLPLFDMAAGMFVLAGVLLCVAFCF
jgi:hypothetical protein